MDHTLSEMIVAVIIAVFASSGFWLFISKMDVKRSAANRMLLGLGHDRIVYLCLKYISAGCVTSDEFENLHDYLYVPYVDMGGNGSARKYMEEVKKLPTSCAKPIITRKSKINL
jgi:hypothetical protein